MQPLVTIGMPVYKRLAFLPHILQIVEAQDYPQIELVVSDNGMNGAAVEDIVTQCYSRPYRFRRNPSTVSISQHYNQLVHAASGKYFVLLSDDDEISDNYVSELVAGLERHPGSSAAIARQEIMDESGAVVRGSSPNLPEVVAGPDFIRAVWQTHEYRFECFATFMARTEAIRACGAYPDFTTGTHNDNALLIKLCLMGDVVLSDRCCFRWRLYEASHGWSISINDLAKASREFLEFLKSDPTIRDFERLHPDQWAAVRICLEQLGWMAYYWRWDGLYRQRLSTLEWLRAAYAMPAIWPYYRRVFRTLLSRGKTALAGPLTRRIPTA
jgi:glycosyltransferase involved in cell wall biosynthesis